ncbi:arginine--tRNA ligase [Buchnera aphidicola]|uniref:arginine--tRNA ligase n=1 Tax=Buchnera aphidicola TaxID=9 RepID=UPI0031B8478F
MKIKKILNEYLIKACLKEKIPHHYISSMQWTDNTKLWHYQINGIIPVASKLKINTKILSEKIIKNINSYKIFKKIKYSSPGFINILIDENWISKKLENIYYSTRLGIKKNVKKTVVIDYSSPNMAKEMHVGHLRSTIIGDVMARTMEFIGYQVKRMNHIGDWGIQFGMMIALIKKKKKLYKINQLSLQDLEKFYQKSKQIYEKNIIFKKKSHQYLIELQKKNKKYIEIWKKIIEITMIENQKIYDILNISLKKEHILGESFYIHFLPHMIKELKKKKITNNHLGNIIVYLENIKNKHGKPMGVILKKNDSSFLYSTIDLACLKYRMQILKANRIIYYTDIRQKQHLKQIEIIAKKAKYVPENFHLEHHAFGMVLTKENKPFKTREGKPIKLKTLIKESIKKSTDIIKKKNPYLNKKKISYISKIIGISAIKYSDLSKNRTKNYIFDWNKMLSFQGNTALYIQYTYTRICSIIKKNKLKIKKKNKKIILKKKIEIQISIKILQFEEILEDITNNGFPHFLCIYLFKLSSLFSIFYEKYPILYAKKIKTKYSRIKLSVLVAKTIKLGLKLLGIHTIEKM